MGTPQSAIMPETGAHGLFMVLRAADSTTAKSTILKQCARFSTLATEIGQRDPEANLAGAVGFGEAFWDKISPKAKPSGLKRFVEIKGEEVAAPATGGDLFIHIHSDRQDLNFLLAKEFFTPVEPYVELLEEIHGFRYLDARDLTGFIDGTENPEGEERAEVALIDEEEKEFEGGSYIILQRYVHHIEKWDKMPAGEQEKVFGRTKADSVELEDEQKPPTAHISRVVIEENGEELEIVRHSMPYGTVTGDSGLVFLAYSNDSSIFDKMLARMYGTADDDLYDRLMDFSSPKTGAYFFAPSLETLAAIAK